MQVDLQLSEVRRQQRRKGQTLAEFALTLPILLLLTFGTIEFGRLFQAWVTIQNAAREATRYTTTGQYDEEKYSLDLIGCAAGDERGSMLTVRMNSGSPYVDIFAVQDPITGAYVPQEESIFATWYDGENCDLGKPEHLELRKDILRLASIMDVARIGAAGLSLEPNPRDGSRDSIWQMMLDQWELPAPRSSEPSYFNVVICSSRGYNNANSTPAQPGFRTRFLTIYEDSDIPPAYNHGFKAPYCMLNEIQPEESQVTSNWGLPWLDPGGPGDRVSVFVTFNHPLITPLGLAEYVTMSARRSGVNESFRASRALNAVLGAPPGVTIGETNTPLPPTDTPENTATNTPSATLSATPSNTPTSTERPFDCTDLSVSSLSFFQQRVYITIENRHSKSAQLQEIYLTWRTPVEYPGMYLSSMALNSEVMWFGERNVAPFYTNSDLTVDERNTYLAADRTIPGGGEVSIWEAAFLNAGFNIAEVMDPWDFHDTKFYIINPDVPTEVCEVVYNNPPPDPEDVPPPVGDPTDTYTPDCASTSISVEFVTFDSFGVIQLRVTNNRFQPAPLLGFNIAWPDPATGFSTNLSGVLTLRKISVGGLNADDFGFPGAEGTLVWRGKEDWNDGKSLGDRQPNTTHGEGSFWRNDYVFPPQSVTNLWLDFDGTSGRLDNAFGFGSWMLNGTFFDLGCGTPGGSGGGGGGTSGTIFLANNPVPPPTNTPRPSNTPGPTFTPSPTRPSPTPSNTWTPGPTRTPSRTPTVTNTSAAPPPTPVNQGTGS